jgi:hypothetical protein
MEAEMPASWSIVAEWEPLDSGPPEERACFAALGVQANGIWLTEGSDALANRLRQAPLLSAYHFAEWLAWNWWRLRWEPRSKAKDWAYAHRVATIGSGYIWPNLTIFSDGERTALIAKPTDERPQTPFRYITDRPVVVPASELETELDIFIDQVLERLAWAKVPNSNLEKIWRGVCEERRTPDLARARKLEALLGQDPDESNPQILDQLAADAQQLSVSAIEELAAEHGQSNRILTADELREIADRSGFDASPRSTARLTTASELPRGGQVPAWRLGAQAAQALREQEGLDREPISDVQLADMAGVQVTALGDRKGVAGISFALDENLDRGRVVLRSKWYEGRRFELARLLGDRVAGSTGGRLLPATRAYTYRQKMQRSFAAEFLSPFAAVDEMLEGDYSMENQQDVASRFQVSPLTIRTLLVNHGRLEREELDEEFDAAAA